MSKRRFSVGVISLDGTEMPACLARAENRIEAEGVAKTAISNVGNFVIGVFDGFVAIEKGISSEYTDADQ